MPLDAPVVAALAAEIQRKLPLKVDRIHQPYPDEFIFGLFGAGVSSRLLISVHSQFGRIHFFEGSRDNPASPSPFCMLLRKHFGGAKLIGCQAVPFERVVKLEFEAYDPYSGLGRKTIWIELTGKSANLILTDERNLIIDARRKTNNASALARGRELLPAAPYQLPPTGERWKPVTISVSQFAALLAQVPPEITLEKFFLKQWYGLSSLAIHEITRAASLYLATPCGEALPESGTLYHSFQSWSDKVAGGFFTPTGLFDRNGNLSDYAAFPVSFPPAPLTAGSVTSMNQAVATVANHSHEASRFQLQQQSLIKKIQHRLEKDRSKLAKQEAEALVAEQADQWRIAGELLTIYQGQILKGSRSASLSNHYDPEGQPLTVQLNPALTPLGNAQAYFKKYQKAKKGQREIALQMEKTREAVAYLESVTTMAERAITETDLKMVEDEFNQAVAPPKNQSRGSRVPKKEPRGREPVIEPRRFTTAAGHQILVGRNNIQNDRLTFKIAAPGDWWFHTQKTPGSHVILKANPGTAVDEEALNLACQLAVYFSKAKGSTKVPVDYTERKNVKKPPGSKPGFVIYDHFKTAIITPEERLLTGLGLPY